MSKDLIARYIWLVDTLSRYRRLTRSQINTLWMRSSLSQGEALPERTFFHYRRAIEENFHIDILCTPQGEYYIDETASKAVRGLSNWLVDSFAVSNILKESVSTAGRVEVEDVPSAREFLPTVLKAMEGNERLTFTYQSFSRSRPEKGILFCPYFLKRYKQRWYMYGRREPSGDLRTYALDRVSEMKVDNSRFEMPEKTDVDTVFGNIIGITSSKAQVRNVSIRASRNQAKYLRALPLHPTQSEAIHDHYSIFSYRLRLNYELVSELLSMGPEVQVLEPPELKAMVVSRLKETLKNYS